MNNAERGASAINTGRLVWDGPNVHAAAPSFLSGSPILFVASPESVDGGYEVATAGFGPALPTPVSTATWCRSTTEAPHPRRLLADRQRRRLTARSL